ncbi:MAG: hypothetical protein R3D32_15105 [Nitratireductor sp.]
MKKRASVTMLVISALGPAGHHSHIDHGAKNPRELGGLAKEIGV